MKRFISGLTLALALTTPALAGDRVDFYDTSSRRTGYAIIDQRTGRIDFYGTDSRRTGYGQVRDGRVDLYGTDSRRQGSVRGDVLGRGSDERGGGGNGSRGSGR